MKKSNNDLVRFNTDNFFISQYWSFYIRSFEILTPTPNYQLTKKLNDKKPQNKIYILFQVC